MKRFLVSAGVLALLFGSARAVYAGGGSLDMGTEPGDVASAVIAPGVHYSPDRHYAFPVAGPINLMSWTHYHWNGSNAVDIMPAFSLPSGSPGRAEFAELAVVAVTAGTVIPANNPLGGIALVLQGDDGRQYYYAHLRSTWVSTQTRVAPGEELGIVGRTGRWTRYIETHLHFAISSSWHSGLAYKNDVNAAEWLYRTFDLHWQAQEIPPYQGDRPHGSPFRVPYKIVSSFAANAQISPDLASIEIEPESPAIFVPVLSTMTGQVRVMRDTVLGLRVQITNLPDKQTIVFSGLAALSPDLGAIARAGQVIGYASGRIDYMYFNHGVLTDPATTLESSQ